MGRINSSAACVWRSGNAPTSVLISHFSISNKASRNTAVCLPFSPPLATNDQNIFLFYQSHSLKHALLTQLHLLPWHGILEPPSTSGFCQASDFYSSQNKIKFTNFSLKEKVSQTCERMEIGKRNNTLYYDRCFSVPSIVCASVHCT